jgi:site-specific DNA recombinase
VTVEWQLRCAIYTRRSSEEGLEKGFNSLEAQREACEAYLHSQAHRGWIVLPHEFNDAGYSGGNLERPALKSLLAMVENSAVDVVVVYRIDRLSRSLMDFVRVVETLDRQGVALVSVTQQFNTATPIGQLTQNILLSFAQFERELTGERIREKIAASKRRGMWMGGMAPMGYDAVDGKLVLNPHDAATVRRIFGSYLEEETIPRLARRLRREGVVTALRYSAAVNLHGGRSFSRGHLAALLSSPVYIGHVPHKTTSYPGQHEPLIDGVTWGAVQAQLVANAQEIRRNARSGPALRGLLVSERGRPFHHAHASKNGRRYRYYVEQVSTVERPVRLSADEIEETVLQGLRALLMNERRTIDRLGGAAPVHLPAAIAGIRLMRRALLSPSALEKARVALRQVELHRDRLVVTVSTQAMRRLVGLPAADGNESADFEVRTKTRPPKPGRRKIKVIVAEGESQPADPSLIAAVVRARSWMDKLIAGEVRSVAEICRYTRFSEGYVRSLLPLAFLPPATVEAMFSGMDEAALFDSKRTTQIRV